jgi:poly [ADP-ribose] polymerase
MSSQLELAVQELISLICDIKTMEQSVVEMEYDTKKAPLGKITTEQVIFIQIGRSLTALPGK